MSNAPLFHKYNITRTDGKPMGEAFVIELDDPFAKVALNAYADACEKVCWELAADMRQQYGLYGDAK